MSYFEMNVSAAFIIITTILLRKAVMNKTPHAIFEALWFLAVLRLLLPFSIRSKLSMFNLYYYLRVWIEKKVQFKKSYNFYIYKLLGNYIDLDLLKQIVLIVWFIGIILLGLYFLICYRKDIALIKDAGEFYGGSKIKEWLISQGFKRKVNILMSCEIDGALSSGFGTPVILLPPGFDFDEGDILARQVILHEYMHIKYFHSWIKLVIVAVLCLNWFNPLIWVLYSYICRDMEISCDKHVLRIIGDEHKKSYALNIVHAASCQSKNSVVYNGFSKSFINERVSAIMNFKKISAGIVIMSLAVPMMAVNVFATTDNRLVDEELNNSAVENVEKLSTMQEEVMELAISAEDIKPYIADNSSDTRAVSRLEVIDYKYVTYNELPPKSITLSIEDSGYTYRGTVTCTDIKIDGSKYTGFYSGTLYKQ